MTEPLLPLSEICPGWTGSLIASAHLQLRQGLASERKRFGGKPFIVTRTCRAFDHDGLLETIELVEGFADVDSAIASGEQLANSSREEALRAPTLGEYRWRLVEDAAFLTDRPDSEHVRCVFRERFKAVLTVYDSQYYEIDVLATTTSEPIDDQLFAYLDLQHALVRYLISRAKQRSAE